MADLVAYPDHGGALAGAECVGRATLLDRSVEIGLFFEGDRVVRARFQASTCASLIAYAEVACRALESGERRLSAESLEERVRGVHPLHRNRAAAVSIAVARALTSLSKGP